MKRFRISQHGLILFITIALVMLGKYSGIPINHPQVEAATSNEAANPVKSTNLETAVVTRVIDGDTIEIDSGEKVRYIGMDTPEITKGKNECYGQAASEKNSELVLNKTITMKKDVSDRDRFGRLLRYVWAGDTFINAELLKLGYAAILTIPPDVSEAANFKQLQDEARSAGRGLWKNCGSAHKIIAN